MNNFIRTQNRILCCFKGFCWLHCKPMMQMFGMVPWLEWDVIFWSWHTYFSRRSKTKDIKICTLQSTFLLKVVSFLCPLLPLLDCYILPAAVLGALQSASRNSHDRYRSNIERENVHKNRIHPHWGYDMTMWGALFSVTKIVSTPCYLPHIDLLVGGCTCLWIRVA